MSEQWSHKYPDFSRPVDASLLLQSGGSEDGGMNNIGLNNKDKQYEDFFCFFLYYGEYVRL